MFKNNHHIQQINQDEWIAYKNIDADRNPIEKFRGTKTDLEAYLSEHQQKLSAGAAKGKTTLAAKPEYQAKRKLQIPNRIAQLEAQIKKLKKELASYQ